MILYEKKWKMSKWGSVLKEKTDLPQGGSKGGQGTVLPVFLPPCPASAHFLSLGSLPEIHIHVVIPPHLFF